MAFFIHEKFDIAMKYTERIAIILFILVLLLLLQWMMHGFA
ncbi:hypothetical protein [Acinetobacter celticus]|nr:hypothetical protein [Acinetobacter celticus]